jgi:rubrerythrin
LADIRHFCTIIFISSEKENFMPNTQDNLKEAFAGESQANRKYLAFAKKAEKEGFPVVARLFRSAAEAETIHAHAHLAAMNGIGSTLQNLQAAVAGETEEFTHMYPPMIQQAETENHKQAKRAFSDAAQAEAVHAKLYQLAVEAVKNGKDLSDTAFYLCPICGNIELGQPPATCPICGNKGENFVKM